jgi:hypothetical protein
MVAKLPFSIRVSERKKLPSFERSGHVAQELYDDLVFVEFTQTESIITTITGLPVTGLSGSLCRCVPDKNVKETVVVGTLLGKDSVLLIDIITINGSNIRTLPWEKRDERLRFFCKEFSKESLKMFPMSRVWSRGLMRWHKDVIDNGGKGLILRVPGKASVVFVC